MNQENEKYLPTKHLAAEMRKQFGLVVSDQYVRSMLKSGVPRCGWCAKLSDVMEWWRKNPSFSPRAKNAA